MTMENSWNLVNAEEEAQRYPTSFEIPSSECRESLKGNDRAKLIFRDSVGCERMWVELTSACGTLYTGKLINSPISLKGIQFGDKVEFGPEHVIDFMKIPCRGPGVVF